MPEFDAFFRIDRMIHLPTPTIGHFDSLKIIELAQLRFVMRQGSGKLSHRHDLRNLPRNSYPARNWPVLSYRDDERKDSPTAVHSDDWLPDDAVGCELLSNEVGLMTARSFELTLG